jgi:hypothetical protein
VGPTLLANLSMEDGSGFQNFTRMTASDFELLVTLTGFEVSRQDTNYRKSVTVNEITLILLFSLACWFHLKVWTLISKPFGHFYVISTTSRLLSRAWLKVYGALGLLAQCSLSPQLSQPVWIKIFFVYNFKQHLKIHSLKSYRVWIYGLTNLAEKIQ